MFNVKINSFLYLVKHQQKQQQKDSKQATDHDFIKTHKTNCCYQLVVITCYCYQRKSEQKLVIRFIHFFNCASQVCTALVQHFSQVPQKILTNISQPNSQQYLQRQSTPFQRVDFPCACLAPLACHMTRHHRTG